jgi:hypothetical protein
MMAVPVMIGMAAMNPPMMLDMPDVVEPVIADFGEQLARCLARGLVHA